MSTFYKLKTDKRLSYDEIHPTIKLKQALYYDKNTFHIHLQPIHY